MNTKACFNLVTAGSHKNQGSEKDRLFMKKFTVGFVRSTALFAIAIGFFPVTSHGQLGDGGFEIPHLADGTTANFSDGSSLGSWDVLGSSGVSLINTDYSEPQNGINAFNSAEGTQSLDLTGPNSNYSSSSLSSGVSQHISTTPGTYYELVFDVGRASGTASFYATPSTARLQIDGGSITSFTNSNSTSGYVNWEEFSYGFTATGTTTNITFLNGTTDNNFVGLDDVQIVPEPGSITLVAIGLFAILGVIQRRFFDASR